MKSKITAKRIAQFKALMKKALEEEE